MSNSPFENTNVISLYLEPVLLPVTKTYHNILTVSEMPPGPLAQMVQRVNFPKLSEFIQYNEETGSYPNQCVYCIKRYTDAGLSSSSNIRNFMFAEDIPSVYGYLQKNGYTVMSDLTKLTFKTATKSAQSNRKLVCMFSA
jgi:hypothetical protein